MGETIIKMDKSYDVSVIVLSYNPDLEKMAQTLDSILMQRRIKLQIIVADDGSKSSPKDWLVNYFQEKGFNDYILVINEENGGTVLNYLSGLKVSLGKYTKAISPGDMLVSPTTLAKWYDFLERSGKGWAFSEAVYYTLEDGERKCVTSKAIPNMTRPYFEHRDKLCRWYYIADGDIALGSTMMGLTALQLKYAERIAGRVKYAEDNIWRLMMYFGDVGAYYPRPTVYYEYGTGISTVKSNAWREKIIADWDTASEIMMESKASADKLQKKMLQALKRKKKNVFLALFTRGQIAVWLRAFFFYRKTPTL